jgi:hypothetical protein
MWLPIELRWRVHQGESGSCTRVVAPPKQAGRATDRAGCQQTSERTLKPARKQADRVRSPGNPADARWWISALDVPALTEVAWDG